MKRRIVAALSVLSVVFGVGWALTSQAETPTELRGISVVEHSEHSSPVSVGALARIRLRLSPNEVRYQDRATADQVPQIPVAAQ